MMTGKKRAKKKVVPLDMLDGMSSESSTKTTEKLFKNNEGKATPAAKPVQINASNNDRTQTEEALKGVIFPNEFERDRVMARALASLENSESDCGVTKSDEHESE